MALQEEFKTQGDYLFRHRSYLPIIILVVGMAVFAYSEYHKIEISDTWVSKVIMIISVWLLVYSVFLSGLLQWVRTPQNTSGRNTKGGQLAEMS